MTYLGFCLRGCGHGRGAKELMFWERMKGEEWMSRDLVEGQNILLWVLLLMWLVLLMVVVVLMWLVWEEEGRKLLVGERNRKKRGQIW